MLNRSDAVDTSNIKLKNIVTASDLLGTKIGLNEILLARIIDNSICLSTKYDHIEKKYRRYQSNDFFLPRAYYFIEKLDDGYLCKPIVIPSPYFISSHDSLDLSFDFSGIVFEEQEAKDFFSSKFFKKYEDNFLFYSTILNKIIKSGNHDDQENIVINELIQELRLYRFYDEIIRYHYIEQYENYSELRHAESTIMRLEGEVERLENSPQKVNDAWERSIMNAVRYVYMLGVEKQQAPSKDDTLQLLRGKSEGMITGVFNAFWKGLPNSAKAYTYNTPEKFKKQKKSYTR